MTKTKKAGCGCLVMALGGGAVLLLGFMVIGVIMSAGSNSTGTTSPSTAAPNVPGRINSEFDQVGYFKSDKMRGMTYYVNNPNKEDIKAFCQTQLAKLPEGRILKIHFYDDRENTPNVSLKYFFPESSVPSLVADFANNPFNGSNELNFHKEISPEPPVQNK